jgi:carbohydrate kinase (thermoresistant glucokinase family)
VAEGSGARGAWRIVVMGVSGCGKTTLGQALADVLQVPFVEGDALHPPRNVALMAQGIALTDADREGWLDAVGRQLAEAAAAARGIVVSCSALKRSYRDRLRAAAPDVRFVYLHGQRDLLAERLAARRGHYMPVSLLPSQLATLQPPTPDEHAVALDIALPTQAQCEQAIAQLAAAAPHP